MKAGTLTCAITVAVLLGLAASERKNWVLLVSGSACYWNYRHEADMCHAYQIARANGIPEEQIVMMMLDEIAYHDWNPYPGEVINHPDGPNVHPGVVVDYHQEELTAAVFLAVLQGDKETVQKLTGQENPKVIASGPEDHVFVNYVDHGIEGAVFMVHGNPIYATELNEALRRMHEQKQFAKLVFYTEACCSGSMFEGLLADDINVYATTAADREECSWACYFDEERDAYLGDEYSVSWMENCDDVDINTESLGEQFEIVKERTASSTVMQFGDLSMRSLPVGEFLGIGEGKTLHHGERQLSPKAFNTSVARHEISIFTLKQLLKDPRMADRQVEIKSVLEEQLWLRAETDALIFSVIKAALPNEDVDRVLNRHSQIQQRAVYERALDRLLGLCPRLRPSFNDFSPRRLNVMVTLSNIVSLESLLEAVHFAAQGSPLCRE